MPDIFRMPKYIHGDAAYKIRSNDAHTSRTSECHICLAKKVRQKKKKK